MIRGRLAVGPVTVNHATQVRVLPPEFLFNPLSDTPDNLTDN